MDVTIKRNVRYCKEQQFELFEDLKSPKFNEFNEVDSTLLELEKGVYDKNRFLDILRKYDFDIGHIIFGYGERNTLLLELVDMKETNDLR